MAFTWRQPTWDPVKKRELQFHRQARTHADLLPRGDAWQPWNLYPRGDYYRIVGTMFRIEYDARHSVERLAGLDRIRGEDCYVGKTTCFEKVPNRTTPKA